MQFNLIWHHSCLLNSWLFINYCYKSVIQLRIEKLRGTDKGGRLDSVRIQKDRFSILQKLGHTGIVQGANWEVSSFQYLRKQLHSSNKYVSSPAGEDGPHLETFLQETHLPQQPGLQVCRLLC
jgi:hypothetical protein